MEFLKDLDIIHVKVTAGRGEGERTCMLVSFAHSTWDGKIILSREWNVKYAYYIPLGNGYIKL